jgi:hypothetical protein
MRAGCHQQEPSLLLVDMRLREVLRAQLHKFVLAYGGRTSLLWGHVEVGIRLLGQWQVRVGSQGAIVKGRVTLITAVLVENRNVHLRATYV